MTEEPKALPTLQIAPDWIANLMKMPIAPSKSHRKNT